MKLNRGGLRPPPHQRTRSMTSPQIVQALTIAAALELYATHKIKANSAYTPMRMMQTAYNITGVRLRSRDYMGAAHALRVWAADTVTVQPLSLKIAVEDHGNLLFGYGFKGKTITFDVGGDWPATWSSRTAEIELADGSKHIGMVEICDSDSGEHYGTGIYLPEQNYMAFQDDADFLERLGKTKEQVFPYRYRYHGWENAAHDIHIGKDGWS